MARKTKEEAQATRESILDAAETVFLDKGVSAATLEQIAREAGVTRGAVYWHFKNKEDLLLAMRERTDLPLSELMRRAEPGAEDNPVEQIRSACRCALRRLATDQTFRNVNAIFLTRCELIGEHNPNFGQTLKIDDDKLAEGIVHFEHARELGLLKPGVTPRIASLSLFALMHGIFLSWLRSPARFEIQDEGNAMLDLYFDNILNRPEPPRSG